MNLKKLTKVKDEWGIVPPSSSLINRLMKSLRESHEIISGYFLSNPKEDAYLDELDDMMAYFSNYK